MSNIKCHHDASAFTCARCQLERGLAFKERALNAARAEAVLEYASQKDALVGGPHEGAHRANALAYVKAQGWLPQPKEGQ